MYFQCPFCHSVVSVDNSDCGINVQCGQCGELTSSPTSRISSGVVIGGDFIIHEELGRGGMGVVFLAHQISLDRPTALKILAPRYAGNSEFISGFIKEARAAAKLNHAHIVQAYAVGEEDGIYYFAMEFIDGETMKTVLKRENLIPVDKALAIIQQIAEALDYAWKEQQLIHRDIKPDNIMMTKNGRAKLADLGLAKFAGEIDDADKDEVMGTPQYISPEHLTGMPMDVRSDIYSLGATFYHLVTGRFAFTGKDALEIARKHIEAPLDDPRSVNPAIPESVSAIIVKMLEKEPDSRYQNAEVLAEDIRLVRRGKSPVSAVVRHSSSSSSGLQLRRPSPAGRSQAGKTLTMNTVRSGSRSDLRAPNLSSGFGTRSGIHHAPIGATAALRKMKEKKAKRQVIVAISVLLACVVGVAAFFIYYSMQETEPTPKKGKKSAAGQKGSKPQGSSKEQPSNGQQSELEKKLSEIVAISKRNPPPADSEILKACDEFAQKFTSPSSDAEKTAFAQFLQIYIPLDEKRISLAREPFKKEKSAHVEKLKQEDDARRKEEEAKRAEDARKAEIERKRLEEENKKKEQEAKEARELDEYKTSLDKQKDGLVYRAMLACSRNEYDSAAKIFDTALQEKNKISDPRRSEFAKDFSVWAQKMQTAVVGAQKFYDKLMNSETVLAGMKIELQTSQKRNEYGSIVKVSNGEITFKNSSNQIVKVLPLKEQSLKVLRLISKKLSSELSLEENAFGYMMLSAEFELANEYAASSAELKNLLSETAVSYIRQKLNYSPEEAKAIKAKYGKLEDYKKATQQ